MDRHLEVVPDDDDAHDHDDQSIGQHEPRALEKDLGNGVVSYHQVIVDLFQARTSYQKAAIS